jgi:hypothetical protein
MTKAELGELRSLKSLPRIYSINESIQNSYITIVSIKIIGTNKVRFHTIVIIHSSVKCV